MSEKNVVALLNFPFPNYYIPRIFKDLLTTYPLPLDASINTSPPVVTIRLPADICAKILWKAKSPSLNQLKNIKVEPLKKSWNIRPVLSHLYCFLSWLL